MMKLPIAGADSTQHPSSPNKTVFVDLKGGSGCSGTYRACLRKPRVQNRNTILHTGFPTRFPTRLPPTAGRRIKTERVQCGGKARGNEAQTVIFNPLTHKDKESIQSKGTEEDPLKLLSREGNPSQAGNLLTLLPNVFCPETNENMYSPD